MIREVFRELREGATDALRTYAALVAMPFTLARSLAHTVSKALH